MRASLTAVAFLSVAVACAANRGRDDRARRGERTAPVVAQIDPIGLPRPRPLAEGDVCVGVVSRVIPSRHSESQGYWGCFDPGEIDRAFSPGIVSSPPILRPAPTSVIEFDSTELEHRGDPVGRSDEDSDPERENRTRQVATVVGLIAEAGRAGAGPDLPGRVPFRAVRDRSL